MTTKQRIEAMVKELNALTNQNYIVDYDRIYGGYALYQMDGGKIVHGTFGFTIRKRPNEMNAYLEGILVACSFFQKSIRQSKASNNN